jgi:phosphate acetyltransferase
MSLIENKTFDEIKVGDIASLTRTLKRTDVELFAAMSGDINPVHVDEEFAKSDMFHRSVGHAMWAAALISTVLGTELPGPGTIYVDQSLRFCRPIVPGETIAVSVSVREKEAKSHIVCLECWVINEAGEVVIDGVAHVIAPTEKISRPGVVLPNIRFEERGVRHRKLVEDAQLFAAIRTAVVYPVDAVSLSGAVEAGKAGLIEPVLVGPEPAIRSLADEARIDLSHCSFVAASNAEAAAAKAVEMAAQGSVSALMKGDLHTDAIMHAVVSGEPNLRTDRRMSHVFVMDVPSYDRPLLVTDAAVNIYPDLATKRDIVQNAIDLAYALGVTMPNVAILSAVETITPKIKSTIEAASLCKMADRGQITGGRVDGPLAFDNAVSLAAAEIKHIHSDVSGRADILVVPDLEAGNMLAKQLEYLADAEGAGIVLGARVPIILTSRADSTESRLASAAVAVLLAHHNHANHAGILKCVLQDGAAA